MADPLVLLHCALARGRAWGAVPLPGRDVTAPDLPGHGRAPEPPEGAEYQAHAMAAALPDRPSHVVGHSFGGTVALRMALEHPDRVTRLTLIEPVFFAAADDPAARRGNAEAFAPVAAAMEAGDREGAARAFTGIWGGGAPWASLPEAHRRYMADRIHLVIAQGPAIHDDVAGQLPRLGEVKCPVTLVRGARSPAIVAAIHAGLMRRMPQAREVVIEGAGHMVPMTHPRAVAEAILGG
ncbi:MAG: alpha/beta fold hydrolase [Shimia sp.]